MKLWRNAKEGSAEQGAGGRPVALVGFHMKDIVQMMTVSTPISAEAVQYVKGVVASSKDLPSTRFFSGSTLNFLNGRVSSTLHLTAMRS